MVGCRSNTMVPRTIVSLYRAASRPVRIGQRAHPLLGGRQAGGAGHAQLLPAGPAHRGRVPDTGHLRVRHRAQRLVDHQAAVVVHREPGLGGQLGHPEPGRPHHGVRRDPVAAGQLEAGVVHRDHLGLLVHLDAEPGEGARQVASPAPGERVAQLAAGDQVHPRPGQRLGQLGGRLDAGQPAADHRDHLRVGQPRAQSLRLLDAGQRVRVLGDARHRLQVRLAAQRVDQPVVAHRVAGSEGDLPAGRVDRGDPVHHQPHPGALQQVPDRQVAQRLARGQLVQPHPLHEPVPFIDQRDVRVGPPRGQFRRRKPGVAGADNHDVHLSSPLLDTV